MPTSRNLGLDVVKAVAVIFVILIHTRSDIDLPPLINFLYTLFFIFVTTCVPLFMLASGYLVLNKKESAFLFFKKRLPRLITPWLFWTIIFFFLLHFLNPQTNSLSLKMLGQGLLSYFWFIPVIFTISVFVPFLRKMVTEFSLTSLGIIIGVWYIFLIIIPSVLIQNGMYPPTSIPFISVQFMGVYILGFALSKITLTKKFPLFWGLSLVVLLLFIYAENFYFPPPFHFRLQSFPYSYLSPEYILTCVTAFNLLSIMGEKIKKESLKKIISFISQHSLGIYLTHITLLLFFQDAKYTQHFIFQYFIITTLVSLCLVSLLSKTPVLKKLV